jgi:hypothetical protein
MFDQSEAEAMCLCGCGERTHSGSSFLPGHDRKAEKKILDIHYGGSVLGLLHFHNYRSGADLQRAWIGHQARPKDVEGSSTDRSADGDRNWRDLMGDFHDDPAFEEVMRIVEAERKAEKEEG